MITFSLAISPAYVSTQHSANIQPVHNHAHTHQHDPAALESPMDHRTMCVCPFFASVPPVVLWFHHLLGLLNLPVYIEKEGGKGREEGRDEGDVGHIAEHFHFHFLTIHSTLYCVLFRVNMILL